MCLRYRPALRPCDTCLRYPFAMFTCDTSFIFLRCPHAIPNAIPYCDTCLRYVRVIYVCVIHNCYFNLRCSQLFVSVCTTRAYAAHATQTAIPTIATTEHTTPVQTYVHTSRRASVTPLIHVSSHLHCRCSPPSSSHPHSKSLLPVPNNIRSLQPTCDFMIFFRTAQYAIQISSSDDCQSSRVSSISDSGSDSDSGCICRRPVA